MLKYSVKEICDHIDLLFQNLMIARSVLPYITDSMVGKSEIRTPGYYKETGYSATIRYDEPLTLGRIKNINEASDSINQGFIIRLLAVLEDSGVYPPIKKNLYGNEELDILKRLRNVFAHGFGERDHDKHDKVDHDELYDDIVRCFNLKKEDYPLKEKQFPIPIDAVIEPLIKGCKKYIIELNKVV